MRIEVATFEDASLLAELNQPVQELHARTVPEFFRPASKTEIESFFRDLLKDEAHHAFVAYEGSKPVGYVLLVIRERPPTPFSYARRWLLVDQISVLPEYEGMGYGQGLMHSAFELAHCEGITDIETETWSFNERAQAFFRQQGFKPRSERLWQKI